MTVQLDQRRHLRSIGLAALMLACLADGNASAEVVLAGPFDDGELAANPSWVVEEGELRFGGEGRTTLHLDLGNTRWKEPDDEPAPN